MPSTPRRTFKTHVHRRVAAATLATFALALGAVTFAGSPLPQTGSATNGTAATTTTATPATTTSSSDATGTVASSTSQPVSSPSSGQTSGATLTTATS